MGEFVSAVPEPVLGWRLWKFRGDQLESWGIDYNWNPGENQALCLAPPPAFRLAMGYRLPTKGDNRDSHIPPGRDCGCGFWGLWSLGRCLSLAGRSRNQPRPVLGLIAGWGVVAIHGKEGFRAEKARVSCLFTDWVWDLQPRSAILAGLARAGRLQFGRPRRPVQDGSTELGNLAAAYGVPLVSLADAVSNGVLQELGAGKSSIDEVVASVDAAHRPRR